MYTVILVHPNITISSQKYLGGPFVPSGVLHVGTALHHAGYRVKIIDQSMEKDWKLRLTEALKERVICLGISSKTGTQISNGLEISEFVRTHSTIPLVWGGVHPTLLPEQTLENEFVDIVVRGEGEETMVELTNALKHNNSLSDIRGISYKEQGEIIHNPDREFIDLDEQPFPQWELIDLQDYITEENNGRRSINIAISRGCPFNCGYCYVNVFHKRRWRALSVDNVVKMMEFLVNRYSINHFLFNDEEFFIDLKRGKELLRNFKRLNIHWEACVRIDTILRMDDTFLNLLEKSGCTDLGVGVESGSNRMLSLMKKKITREDVIKANRKLANYDLNVIFLFMVGFPTETVEEMKETVSLVLQIKRENKKARTSNFSIFTPLPGSELHDLAIRHGFKQPDCLEEWATFYYTMSNTAWFPESVQRIVKMLAFTSPFLNDFIEKYYPPLHVKLLRSLYRPIAKQRIKHFFFHFPLEISLARLFKLY